MMMDELTAIQSEMRRRGIHSPEEFESTFGQSPQSLTPRAAYRLVFRNDNVPAEAVLVITPAHRTGRRAYPITYKWVIPVCPFCGYAHSYERGEQNPRVYVVEKTAYCSGRWSCREYNIVESLRTPDEWKVVKRDLKREVHERNLRTALVEVAARMAMGRPGNSWQPYPPHRGAFGREIHDSRARLNTLAKRVGIPLRPHETPAQYWQRLLLDARCAAYAAEYARCAAHPALRS